MLSRRAFAGAIFGTAFISIRAAGAADSYPSRPIRVISPFPAGSASDTVGRVVLDKVSQILGQAMVIEAKPGAGGIVGFADVAKADPDGYTLVTSSTSMGTGLVLHKHLPYDPDKDFVSVAMFGVQPNVLVASTESGFKTVADLVAAAKAKPGVLTFASAGVGSSSHMAGEKLRLAAKIDVRHVPFKENGLTEVMAGRIDYYFIPLAAAASALRSDKLTVLAVSSPKRVPLLPNVPSIAEAGYPGSRVQFLGRTVGAGEDAARHRRQAARCDRKGAARPGHRGQIGQARRRAGADERRCLRQVRQRRHRRNGAACQGRQYPGGGLKSVIASVSEAIQSGGADLDCFVALLLAMTANYEPL